MNTWIRYMREDCGNLNEQHDHGEECPCIIVLQPAATNVEPVEGGDYGDKRACCGSNWCQSVSVLKVMK